MSQIAALIEKLKNLPPQRQAEVEAFIVCPRFSVTS